MIFLALPFFFVAFVCRFPAGLLVYWITTNLWTIVQQAIIRKRLGPLRPPTPEGETRRRLIGTLRSLGGGDSKPQRAAEAAVLGAQGAAVAACGRRVSPRARPAGPPPPPPRKKKKRSGRRR